MAQITEDLTLVFEDWNISLVNTTLSIHDEHNEIDFYGEVDSYWMSKVNVTIAKRMQNI